jgi:hypothetical protein
MTRSVQRIPQPATQSVEHHTAESVAAPISQPCTTLSITDSLPRSFTSHFPSFPCLLPFLSSDEFQNYLTKTIVSPLLPVSSLCVAQIKSAYRRLALQCHPDKTKGDPEVCQEFCHISLPPVLRRICTFPFPPLAPHTSRRNKQYIPSSSSGIECPKYVTRLMDSRPD